MTLFLPAYRATVYAPRTVDFSEATILTPAPGAPHSDPFKVITLQGVAGWKPYLGMPQGRRGRMDPLTKKTDVGTLTFPVYDIRAGAVVTDDLTRWLTAFTGDAQAAMQIGGCKVFVEESLDGGKTWNPFFTGRMRGDSLQGRITRQLVAQDLGGDLDAIQFVALPHSQIYGNAARTDGAGGNAYASVICQSPIGIIYPYGPYGSGIPLTGAITQYSSLFARGMIKVDAPGIGAIQFGRAANVITVALVKVLTNQGPFYGLNGTTNPEEPVWGIGLPVNAQGQPVPLVARARVHVKRLDTNAEGEFWLMFAGMTQNPSATSRLGGSRQAFLYLGLSPMAPQGVATGTPLANGAQIAGTASIPTKGWTISTTNILRAGDVISFAGHTTRYVLTADASSDGSGNATLAIAAMLVGGGLTAPIANNEAITVNTYPRSMPLPPASTNVTWSVVIDGPPAPSNPFLISDIHPVQFLQDICRGYYGWLFQVADPLPPGKNYGDPKRVLPYASAAFATLIADLTFPTFRGVFTQSMKARDLIEQYICQACELGYYFDGAGNLTPVDMRMPTTLAGIPTMTDADLIVKQSSPWGYDPTAAKNLFMGKRYVEFFADPTLADFSTTGDVTAQDAGQIVNEGTQELLVLSPSDIALSQDSPVSIDAKGLRSQPGEKITVGSGAPQDRASWAQQVLMKVLTDLEPMVARGPVTISLDARRTANTQNLWPGSLVLISSAWVPDPSTNKRGGTRLIRILERQEKGPVMSLKGIDMGITVASTAPTLGTPAVGGDAYHTASCAITLNGNNPAEVQFCVTPTAVGAHPGDTDAAWTLVGKFRSNGVAWAVNCPPGNKVWFRARTVPTGPQLVSGWTYSTSVTLTNLPSPSVLSVSGIIATEATISWTNGDPGLEIAIYLVSPITDPVQLLAIMQAGTTSYTIGLPPAPTPLVASTQYKVEVRHRDRSNYESPAGTTTQNFTTTAVNPAIPNPGAIAVMSGY